MTDQVPVGVVGVGSMGRHHARVYNELPQADLVGVADADSGVAAEVADRYDTIALDRAVLLDRTDAVSVAVPTQYHATAAAQAMDHGVAPLVEKPFVRDLDTGAALAARARREGLPLQVGHIERFNPAVRALEDVRQEIEPIAVAARRQGPPVDRECDDSAVMDLMIHDIDIVLSVASGPVETVSAVAARDSQHVAAQLAFEDGLIATLTASRVTQEKIRDLSITATDCQVEVDYLDQSVQIHRHSMPEFLEQDGEMRYRHESIIERPTIDNGEPLRAELSAFVDAVRDGTEPLVTAADGLRAIELAQRIEAVAEEQRGEPGVARV